MDFVSIVTFHFMANPPSNGGATYLLLALAGYNFSRFQLSHLLTTDRVVPFLLSIGRIVLPLAFVVVAIGLRKGEIDTTQLLLLSNFEPADQRVLDFWYVEVLAQILLLLALLLAVPALRGALRDHPFAAAAGVALGAVALAEMAPALWDTLPYRDHVPHMLLWVFALGWAMQQAKGPVQKAVAAVLVLGAPALIWGFGEQAFWVGDGLVWIWAGGLLVLAFDTVRVPTVVAWLAQWVGGASLFIYITHYSVLGIWSRVTPVQSELLDILVALVAGVLFWMAWEAASRVTSAALRRVVRS